MKKILPVIALTALMAAACARTEQAESDRAEIEAAMMQGRMAARDILAADPTDTVALQEHLLNARAKQSRYVIEKHPDQAAAFDSAFVSTIRTVRPDLGHRLFP